MYIYKITNILDNKVYIGKSEKDMKESMNYFGSGIRIKRAIHKYGIENFKKEIIFDDIDSIEILNKIEIFMIGYYKFLLKENCYNIATGGTGGNTIKYFTEDELNNFKEKMKKVSKRSDQCGEKNPNWKNKYDTGTLKKGFMFFKHKNDYSNIEYLSLDDEKVISGEFIPFSKNRKLSEDYKKRKSEQMKKYWENNKHPFKDLPKELNPNYGKNYSDSRKKNISVAVKIAKQKNKKLCIYCNKYFDIANYNRWHGENCKYKDHQSSETISEESTLK